MALCAPTHSPPPRFLRRLMRRQTPKHSHISATHGCSFLLAFLHCSSLPLFDNVAFFRILLWISESLLACNSWLLLLSDFGIARPRQTLSNDVTTGHLCTHGHSFLQRHTINKEGMGSQRHQVCYYCFFFHHG